MIARRIKAEFRGFFKKKARMKLKHAKTHEHINKLSAKGRYSYVHKNNCLYMCNNTVPVRIDSVLVDNQNKDSTSIDTV